MYYSQVCSLSISLGEKTGYISICIILSICASLLTVSTLTEADFLMARYCCCVTWNHKLLTCTIVLSKTFLHSRPLRAVSSITLFVVKGNHWTRVRDDGVKELSYELWRLFHKPLVKQQLCTFQFSNYNSATISTITTISKNLKFSCTQIRMHTG